DGDVAAAIDAEAAIAVKRGGAGDLRFERIGAGAAFENVAGAEAVDLQTADLNHIGQEEIVAGRAVQVIHLGGEVQAVRRLGIDGAARTGRNRGAARQRDDLRAEKDIAGRRVEVKIAPGGVGEVDRDAGADRDRDVRARSRSQHDVRTADAGGIERGVAENVDGVVAAVERRAEQRVTIGGDIDGFSVVGADNFRYDAWTDQAEALST